MSKQKAAAIVLIVVGLVFLFYFLSSMLDAKPESLLTWVALALGAGANLKGWVDLFKKEKKEKSEAGKKSEQQIQEMQSSLFGGQSMKGKGGKQRQTMKNSIGGKQNME